ncbi:MAG: HD domain-containing protein [bacterium]|nr:HD domain-containing protein [bacterium]
MQKLIDFFIKAGKVKRLKQRGLVLRGIKDPVTVGAHSFRGALMAWVFAKAGKSELDENRLLKIILVHDLCAGFAGDITPYEPLIAKNKKNGMKQMFIRWIRLSKKEKEYFYAKQENIERKALKELMSCLPKSLALEMEAKWFEYKNGLTPEGRFVQQVDMLENFLQSLEYWREDKKFPIESWWQQMKELIHDPFLIEFLHAVDRRFHQSKGIKRGK